MRCATFSPASVRRRVGRDSSIQAGWPEEGPSTPDRGHFIVVQAEWLDENNEPIPLEGVEKIVIKASEVEMVELMSRVTDDHMEVHNGRS